MGKQERWGYKRNEAIKEYWFQQLMLFHDTHNSGHSVASQVWLISSGIWHLTLSCGKNQNILCSREKTDQWKRAITWKNVFFWLSSAAEKVPSVPWVEEQYEELCTE